MPNLFWLDENTPCTFKTKSPEWENLMNVWAPYKVFALRFHFSNPRTRISTVFLGMDHSFGAEGGPILYETCVFRFGKHLPGSWLKPGGKRRLRETTSEVIGRYRTKEEAIKGHYEAVQWAERSREKKWKR